jgi:hypothetical protein
MAVPSESFVLVGVALDGQMEQGQVVVVAAVSAKEAVVDDPFRLAVTIPVCVVAIVPAVTMNVAVLLPTATATDVGVVKSAVLSDNVTESPPVGAALLNVTVQLLLAPEFKDAGAQTNAVTFTSGARLREAV